ncbi:MAG TPA: isoleucine--tRNA ligase [Candidatus Omnitrophota bacterium]|nr:isoleucine--tRNA ligase [Candidatus Omnitrophota bacterium]
MSYQETLNLPKTSFSMKADLAQKEPKLLEAWEKNGLYQAIRAQAKGKPEFTLHDGPPYANGNIHIGHALNKILKDMIVKFKTMQGFDSLYVPGWDCHGLPIEHQLLKEMKAHKSQVERVDFRRKAHEYAMKYVALQRDQFKRLGVFGEWDKPYLTLTPEYEYWILHSLEQLNQKGYIYRGLKPVNWCASCETALAEAEVEYENHTSPSVYVKFPVSNPEGVPCDLKGKELFLLVWTTTPWTLLANVAVAIHPEYEYSFVETGDSVLILEKTLAEKVLAKGGIQKFKVIKQCRGKDLTKFIYCHPFGLREKCPVVAVDYVTREDGTGLVHTAPGHGQEDFETGLRFKLDVVMPVDSRGIFSAEAGEFAGQHVFKANEAIIAKLNEKKVLFAQENIDHSYPHCWRCKKPVIFRATKQWFARIDHNGLRHKLLEAAQNDVQWIPEAGKERIEGMIKTRPDWCLSRQRYWGVPIPAVICHGCSDEQKLFSEVIGHFKEIVKKEGTSAWFEKDIKDLLPQGFKCPDCGKDDFAKADDILDVWFDSGVSHQAVVKGMMHKDIPVALYLEGSDQHRGWFQSSLIPSVAIDGKPPFKAVLTHGFVVDGQGRKMSKSLGNVVSPQDIIKNYGADFLRLWVASSNYNDDIRVSKEILDRLVDAYRKIRNTVRFILSNLYDFDPDKDTLAHDQLLEIDRWALSRLSWTKDLVEKKYEEYDFAMVYQELYSFCNETLSGIYLDILKDRLYTSAAKSRERASAQTVLYHTIDILVRLLAPVLSFTAHEIFEAMPKTTALKNISSVHLLQWNSTPDDWVRDGDLESKWGFLLATFRPYALKSLEEKRQQGLIGSSLEAKVVIRTASKNIFDQLSRFDVEMLRAVFIVSQCEVVWDAGIVSDISAECPKTQIVVDRADGQKCARCWNYCASVGAHQDHPQICVRCLAVVESVPGNK